MHNAAIWEEEEEKDGEMGDVAVACCAPSLGPEVELARGINQLRGVAAK